MSVPAVTVTIEPDGVVRDHFVVTVAVDGREHARATWVTLETALAQAEARLLRLAYQVFR